MHYREATLSDYEALHDVRLSVKENVLVNKSAVTYNAYKDKLEKNGCGWVCEDAKGRIVGFSIVDLVHNTSGLYLFVQTMKAKESAENFIKLYLTGVFTMELNTFILQQIRVQEQRTFILKQDGK